MWAQRKENESSSLIQDLTCMVKEQKAKLAEVSKLKHETAASLQVRHGPFPRRRERFQEVQGVELLSHADCGFDGCEKGSDGMEEEP